MRFVKWVFLVAAAYGIVLVTPMFFLEGRYGQDYPPAINHPEFYYGFAGCVLAWQLMYGLIGTDPVRYRGCMPLAAAAKLGFAITVALLYRSDRVPGAMIGFASPDAIFGVLFIVAWARTPKG